MLLPNEAVRTVKVLFSAVDGTQDNAFSLDLDPAQMRGSRSAFGAQLQIPGLLEYDRNKAVPLEIGGTLAWHADGGVGLQIPSQLIGNGGSIALMVSISDGQLASIEERRAGAEPSLTLILTALGRTMEGVASYRASWSPMPYVVPRDRWAEAMAACGLGRVHIIELPIPTSGMTDAWSRSAQMLVRGSAEFAQARYGEAKGNARNALQELVTVLERELGIKAKAPAFAERVNELAAYLSTLHERRGSDSYGVLASLIREVFNFSSDPVHRGYDLPNREEAAFALSLVAALHLFLAGQSKPSSTA